MPNIIPDPSDNSYYGFSARDSQRIATVVKRVEAAYYNERPYRQHGPKTSGSAIVPICITTNVIAGSRASPTPFGCTIERPIPPVGAGGGGFTTTGGLLVTGYNRFPRVVFSASPTAQVEAWGIWLNGFLYLVSADCP